MEPLHAENCHTIRIALENTQNLQHRQFIETFYPIIIPKINTNTCFLDTRKLCQSFDMYVEHINAMVIQNIDTKNYKTIYNDRYIKLNILGIIQLCQAINTQRTQIFHARIMKLLKYYNESLDNLISTLQD